MSFLRICALAVTVIAAAACSPAGPATTSTPALTADATPTAQASTGATPAPSASAGATLDPSQSDAGIVAEVTITNDEDFGRDGTYSIVGAGADGSNCAYTFEGDEFQAIAWDDDAPNGQIHQFGVSVPATSIPPADGVNNGITDGGVSFDFASDSGFGTLYVGNSTEEDSGSSTIDVTRATESLTFDFEGASFNGATFSGTLICAEASL